jgi:hypothetical protein
MFIAIVVGIVIAAIIIAMAIFQLGGRASRAQKIYPVRWISSPSDLDVKSGDILLFRHNDMNRNTKYIFGDEFSHIGIVYQDTKTGVIYVLETTAEQVEEFQGNGRNGPKITPIWTRLSTYPGRICIKRLEKPLDIDRATLFDTLIADYHTQSFDFPGWQFFKSCVLMLGPAASENAHCSAFVAQVLEDLHLVEITTEDVCMRPECFVDLYRHGRAVDGYRWGAVSEFKFR